MQNQQPTRDEAEARVKALTTPDQREARLRRATIRTCALGWGPDVKGTVQAQKIVEAIRASEGPYNGVEKEKAAEIVDKAIADFYAAEAADDISAYAVNPQHKGPLALLIDGAMQQAGQDQTLLWMLNPPKLPAVSSTAEAPAPASVVAP